MTSQEFTLAVSKLPLFGATVAHRDQQAAYPGYDERTGSTYLHKGTAGKWRYVTRAVLYEACRHRQDPEAIHEPQL